FQPRPCAPVRHWSLPQPARRRQAPLQLWIQLTPTSRSRFALRVGVTVCIQPWHEQKAVANLGRERTERAIQRHCRTFVGPKRHTQPADSLCCLHPLHVHPLEHVHVREYRVQLCNELRHSLGFHPKPRESRNVHYFVLRDCHAYSHSLSRFACAITSVLRPLSSSSKSILTLLSRPAPVISAIVPAPNFRCLTRAPTAITAASCDSSSGAGAAGCDRREGADRPLDEAGESMPYPREPTEPPAGLDEARPAFHELRPQPPSDAPPVLPHSRSANAERPVLRARAVRVRSRSSVGICERKPDAFPGSSSPFLLRCSAYDRISTSSARVMPT